MTLQAIRTAQDELAMLEELFGDRPRSPAQIRVLISSGFSSIEALISMMMVEARSGILRMAPSPSDTHEDKHRFFFEVCALHDLTYRLDDSGRIKLNPNRPSFKSKTLFSIRSLAKSHGQELEPQEVEDWQAFLKAVKIRNRITHPIADEDLDATEDEFETVLHAFKWIVRCNHRARGGKEF